MAETVITLVLPLLAALQTAPPPPVRPPAPVPPPPMTPALCRSSAEKAAIFNRLRDDPVMDRAMEQVTGKPVVRSEAEIAQSRAETARRAEIIARVTARYQRGPLTGEEFNWSLRAQPSQHLDMVRACDAAPE
jgi:hypothetical protein